MDTPIVFISHSSHDAKRAMEICAFLEEHNIKCWIAPRDIKPGAAYPSEITRGIKECSTFLIVLTNESVHSPHVNTETDIAFNNDKQIIPFFIDNVELGDSMSYYLARKQWILGYEDSENAKMSLLQCLSPSKHRVNKEIVDTTQHSQDNEVMNDDHRVNKPKVYTNMQLCGFVAIVVALFLLFPIVGFALAAIPILIVVIGGFIVFRSPKVQSFLRNHKKKVIVGASVALGALIIFFVSKYNDGRDYARNYDHNEPITQIDSEQTDQEEVVEVLEDASYNDATTKNEHQTIELNSSTIIAGHVYAASWIINKQYYDIRLNGNVDIKQYNLNVLIYILRLHKKSVEGVIEDTNGTNIGYFEGTISLTSLGYQIKGETVVEVDKNSYRQLSTTIVFESTPDVEVIINNEMCKAQ